MECCSAIKGETLKNARSWVDFSEDQMTTYSAKTLDILLSVMCTNALLVFEIGFHSVAQASLKVFQEAEVLHLCHHG